MSPLSVVPLKTERPAPPKPRFIIREVELLKDLCVSRRGLQALIREEGFPKPVRLVGRYRGWVVDEVNEWIDERKRTARVTMA
jgi:predicted DNA-binding transcriptional regulator AlpA